MPTSPVRSFLLVVAALCATSARADTFNLFLRDLNGDLLDGKAGRKFAQVRAFRMRNSKDAATSDGITPQANIVLGDPLSDLLTSDDTGRITMTINLASQLPDDRSIVFIANQEGLAVTAVVPFIVNLGTETQTLNIGVPERPQVPPCVALPHQPCVAPPPPVYCYYNSYQVPTHRHHGLHWCKR